MIVFHLECIINTIKNNTINHGKTPYQQYNIHNFLLKTYVLKEFMRLHLTNDIDKLVFFIAKTNPIFTK